jgi:hypothetical protein
MNQQTLGLDSTTARVVFPFLANSIRFANGLDPAKWGVTPYGDGVRLNVGFCEALTFFRDEARVLVDRLATPPGKIRAMRELYPRRQASSVYQTAPGSALAILKWKTSRELRVALKALRSSHEAILRVAVRRGFNRGSRNGHSNVAVRTIGGQLGVRLPLPSYASDRASDARWEGAVSRTTAVRYERDRTLRHDCLDHYGDACCACGLLFEERYGSEAAGLIHVHHLRPLARHAGRQKVHPVRHLRPVCPNCHAVIHSRRKPYSIDEVQHMLRHAT